MEITRDEVLRLARLARIDLTDAEAEALPPQLDRIVEHVKSLAAVATAGVREAHEALATPLRDDAIAGSLPPGSLERIAPEARVGLLVVPRVIGGGGEEE